MQTLVKDRLRVKGVTRKRSLYCLLSTAWRRAGIIWSIAGECSVAVGGTAWASSWLVEPDGSTGWRGLRVSSGLRAALLRPVRGRRAGLPRAVGGRPGLWRPRRDGRRARGPAVRGRVGRASWVSADRGRLARRGGDDGPAAGRGQDGDAREALVAGPGRRRRRSRAQSARSRARGPRSRVRNRRVRSRAGRESAVAVSRSPSSRSIAWGSSPWPSSAGGAHT